MKPRLLYVASRWPYPVRSGRARMIAQTLEMASDRFEVHLAAFAAEEESQAPAPSHVAGTTRLPRPGALGAALRAVRSPYRPLQSHLFASGAAGRRLCGDVRTLRPQVVMFDMIRLIPYADVVREVDPAVRCVLDMDDLLSARYRQMSGAEDILGAFSRGMPAPVRALAGALPRALLGVETRLVARAEARAPQGMDAVVLVSGREAGILRGATGERWRGRIHEVPPSVPPLTALPRDFSRGIRVVFFGDETYAPNAEALKAFDAMARSFVRIGGRPVRFEAAGRRDDRIRTEAVHRHGYVEDLDAFLGADAVMVAPILTGTGIKTKLLDAFGRGVPVVTTPKGAEGLDLEHGRDVLVEASPAAIAAGLPELLSGASDPLLERVGLSGAARVRAAHDPGRVAANLMRALLGGEAVHA